MLIGASAGAVQMGGGGLTDDEAGFLSTFGFVPFFVGAHEERDDWSVLRRVITLQQGPAQGIGIPFGAGLVYQNDEVIPIRKPLFEICIEAEGRREGLIMGGT